MKNDLKIDIAIGHSRKSRIWKNKKWSWSEIVQKLAQEHKTKETYKEYMAASKDDQSEIKDVGGYVGGYLRAGKRNPQNVVHRQLMTLDIDFAHLDFWEDFQLMFGNAAVLHATHKHHEKSPRFRLVMPLSRECSSDEYVAVSRRVAGDLGIDLFDNTTFEPNRLMYWPSSPKDIDYYFRHQTGEAVDVDKTLKRYTDWSDSSLWPTSQAHVDQVKGKIQKQEDPELKKGAIGLFCRAYSVEDAIETFLSEEYISAEQGRYSYTKGSTSSGLILYDNKFAFSHHGTDPCSGKLCNSFDLVRIHKYGHLDEGVSSKNSLRAMHQFVLEDPAVKKLIASENLSQAKYEFSEDIEVAQETVDWMSELDVDNRGAYKSSATNLNVIFSNDIRLKQLFKLNDFDGKRYIFGNMPWRRTNPPEPMRGVDYSGVRNYIESIYGITGNLKIDDCLALEFEKHSFHPIKEYIGGLTWDQTPRIEKLFIEYFGAEDTSYTREAAKKMLVGAVARVYRPGVKFDLVVTFVGPEGTGKSTFADKLARDWFSDTFMTVHGREALEQIQGAWIIELAELAGLRKADVESVKHFISKREDTFRAAYAKVAETYQRQCIFIGTTNDKNFLKSTTGNRRFIPIDVRKEHVTRSVWDELTEEEVSQLWAEAFVLFRKGEKLYMSGEAEYLAKEEQAKHAETDERAGIVEDYLNNLLPDNWEDRTSMERQLFFEEKGEGKHVRETVCVAEVWCECLGRDRKDLDRYKSREINEMLRTVKGWEQINSTKNFKLYGKQKYYKRKRQS